MVQKVDHSPEFQAVIAALRQVMKSRKITYEDLAQRLGTSAQTVKRLVNGYGDCSLEKLVSACRAVGVEFFDLVKLAGEPSEKTFELSLEQEEFFVLHRHHLAVFNLLRKHKSIAEICADHGLSAACGRRYLRELEAVGVLERLEGDGCRLRFEGGHNWLKKGPLNRRFYADGMNQLNEFMMREPAPQDAERMITWSSTQLSRASLETLMTEMKELGGRYRRLAQREAATLPKAEMLDTEWVMIAAAPFRALVDEPPVEL